MTPLDPEMLDALNMLLEDERASVEMEVALANGATEMLEREAFTTMGSDEVEVCCVLREWLELSGGPTTPRINGVVFQILGEERYDDRLRAFARYQADTGARAAQLGENIQDTEIRKIVRKIHDNHVRDALWCERRAAAFAQSRDVDFREVKSAFPLVPLRTMQAQASSTGDVPDEQSSLHPDHLNASGSHESGADDIDAAQTSRDTDDSAD